jgi:DMSO/TMAO reductase YedYZ molybdopterin-dependent catalytic subunit
MSIMDKPENTNMPNLNKRRLTLSALASASAWVLAGCDKLGETKWFPKILATGENLNQAAHKLAGGRHSMAQEFTEADLSPSFRGNGNTNPDSAAYQAHAKAQFIDWTLTVDGLVETPSKLSIAQLKALPVRTQITRHDCVEGWSAIGKWTGVPLASILAIAKPTAQARFVVLHCADTFASRLNPKVPYYESIDMDDAWHPQTILAYGLNDQALPIKNGAPLRLRVERQLGYKHAKYVTRIELVESFKNIEGGNGGYWEDRGYAWYAGI